MKDCPKCGLISHDIAQQCDCGYDFSSMTVRESHRWKEKKRGDVTPWWWSFWFWVSLGIASLLFAGAIGFFERSADGLTGIEHAWHPTQPKHFLYGLLAGIMTFSFGRILVESKPQLPPGVHVNPPEVFPGIFGVFLLVAGPVMILRAFCYLLFGR